METIWFCLVAIMIAGYVILDGFDLGAGFVSLFVARNERERMAIIGTIGPVWDGNEVWLLAGGGTLYFAFPALYSASFSGFYLALMIVLWLLILRGVSIEIRNHVDNHLWRPFWDFVFGASSALLCLLFGVALGNVIRGVPLDASGFFFIPLWTDFAPGSYAGIVDWYTILIGVASFTALAVHGCLWVALKTTSELRDRARRTAMGGWWLIVVMTFVITALSFRLQPHLAVQFSDYPFGFVFPAIALAGLAGMFWFTHAGNDRNAFLSSCAYLLGMLTSVVFGVYPLVLPASTNPDYSLNIWNAAAPKYGLIVGLWWWIPGMILAGAWSVFSYRRFAGRVSQFGHP
ncbi:MAG TPA: cytochrome d ubiquinol oxidase subunit II [Bryobacteraceae bacterium]|nr:cytochrome d ubiquinol oxidase subunit II [Bryobacteraceae bacterium]